MGIRACIRSSAACGAAAASLGAGYRQFTGDNTFFDIKGLISFSNYKYIETTAATLGLAGGKVNLGAHLGWRDATQVAYYGVGIDTPPEDRSNYRFKQGWVSGDIVARPAWWTVFGANIGYEDFSLESGSERRRLRSKRSSRPTRRRASASARRTCAPRSAAASTRGLTRLRPPRHLHRGPLSQLRRSGRRLSFDQVDAEITQHIPFLRESWVLSLHGLAQMASDDVPYFMMPSLGSGSTLRAFPSWRFRDRNSLLLQAEWRWTPIPSALDMAFFFDAGKVTPERSQLDLNDLKTDFGIGVRFHSLLATPLRVEWAKGNEGAGSCSPAAPPSEDSER